LPELKNRNKNIKNTSKNLLSNIKLLCFIPLSIVEDFYEKINQKYGKKYKNFFKYFQKQYITNKYFDISKWNYNTLIENNLDNQILFYTNNIVESFNKTLNKKYLGYCKIIYNFKNAFKDIIYPYNSNNTYKDRRCCITKALEYYAKSNITFDIIIYADLKNIKKI